MRSRTPAAATAVVLALLLAGCAGGTPGESAPSGSGPGTAGAVAITDMAGRAVTLPARATKVFGAGPPATTILFTLDPGLLAGWNTPVSGRLRPYLSREASALPVLGRVTGGKDTFNPELLIEHGVDLIVDAGDITKKYVSAADELTRRTGIPVVMLSTDPDRLDEGYELLGRLTGRAERATTLAGETRRITDAVAAGAARVPAGRRPSVYYALGATGLTTARAGSIHARVIDAVGARNAAGAAPADGKGGRGDVDAEQVLAWNPDWVLVSPDAPGDVIATNPTAVGALGSLPAFAKGRYLVAPASPFGWVDSPPSVNQLLGMVWLATSLHPQQFTFDLAQETRSFYRTFYHRDLPEKEAAAMLRAAHTPGFR